jgi:hypothetical protein
VLRCREAAERPADDADEIVSGEVRCRHAALREVGVHGIRETVREHAPVGTVDSHRVLDDPLADEGAVFELADAGFEIGGHESPSTVQARCFRCLSLRMCAT